MKKTVTSRGTVAIFAGLPPMSIALDGYCQGPVIDLEGQRFSFDHHENCVRLVTSATCKQVLDALLLGLDPTDYTAYVNDVDGDTALSVWLLQNPSFASEEMVRKLVDIVGAIDSHGPAYPVTDQRLADVFFDGVMKPLVDLQRAKQYATADLDALLATCVENINRLVMGELDWTPAEEKAREFEITHRGHGWAMAKSNDFIFDLLYAEGHTRAIAYQELTDGSIVYTVGKKSELVTGFPVGPASVPGTILYALNEREEGWGGGSTIGGAPRNADGSRSHLTPDEVFAIVESVLNK